MASPAWTAAPRRCDRPGTFTLPVVQYVGCIMDQHASGPFVPTTTSKSARMFFFSARGTKTDPQVAQCLTYRNPPHLKRPCTAPLRPLFSQHPSTTLQNWMGWRRRPSSDPLAARALMLMAVYHPRPGNALGRRVALPPVDPEGKGNKHPAAALRPGMYVVMCTEAVPAAMVAAPLVG